MLNSNKENIERKRLKQNILRSLILKNTAVLFFLVILIISFSSEAKKTLWQKCVGTGFQTRHNLSYQSISAEIWPNEPDSPLSIDPAQFQKALGALCGAMPPDRLELISSSLLRESKRFEVDPFLVAALMIHQSGCRPRTPDRETRWGLTRIDVAMHAPHIRSSEYRYFVKQDGVWKQEALPIKEFRFNQWSVQKIEENLYFASAILSVYSKQCKDLDDEFGSVNHRHPVSHWFFGDKVTNVEPEDAVLTVRRRLIAAYKEDGPHPAGVYGDTALVSPVDGVPRLLLDYFGNKRGNKKGPGHQGIDISGLTGEPIRAVASGRISFAGVDMPEPQPSRHTTPEEAAAIPRNSMGKAGIWVTVNHRNGLRTCYMHLDSLAVKEGDEVEAGQIIGTLGNTGTAASGPHLHLEFRKRDGEREDPAVYLSDILVNPQKKP